MFSSEKSPKDGPNKDGSQKSKSPHNIFLINKELNPMFGIPKKKNESSGGHKTNEEPFKIVNEDRKENVKVNNTEELPVKAKKKQRSVRATGMLKGGFNFVKDAMKGRKGKK